MYGGPLFLVASGEVVPTVVWVVPGPARGTASLLQGLGMKGHAIPKLTARVHSPRNAPHMIPPPAARATSGAGPDLLGELGDLLVDLPALLHLP